MQELQLYGWRSFESEPDPRPLPEGDQVAGVVADIFDAFIATLADTRLEPDLDDLLWSTLFHRAVGRIGVLVFLGSGTQDNLTDKARKLGIPVYRFGKGGAYPPLSQPRWKSVISKSGLARDAVGERTGRRGADTAK